ncbi:MAG: 6,7-dimethyl-8-ribityllumazine synthase [Planctomycetes bacterium]|nr:6,7-dimethyl-8-ribityllumazine synthase [Planctomycetota bacterium]
MQTFEGQLKGAGKSFALVASRFNELIVASLIDGARGALLRLGVQEEDIALVRVPGAFEIPPVARRLAESGRFHGVICLGAVIRGSTPHFDYIAGESAKGVAAAGWASAVPVIYGILTTDSIEQAIERAGTKAGNKGAEAALAAIEMADLYDRLRSQARPSKKKQ